MPTISIENLPNYHFVVIDTQGNIVQGIEVQTLKSEYEIDLIQQIEEGLENM